MIGKGLSKKYIIFLSIKNANKLNATCSYTDDKITNNEHAHTVVGGSGYILATTKTPLRQKKYLSDEKN